MGFVRRYWSAALILMMVFVHAAVIGYVRSRVARLQNLEATTIDVGQYRFQLVEDRSIVYQFRLHAVIEPSRRQAVKERIDQRKTEIHQEAELLLRQSDPNWLNDPEQNEIRDRLLEIIAKYLEEPVVQRVLITDWIELPVSAVAIDQAASTPLATNR